MPIEYVSVDSLRKVAEHGSPNKVLVVFWALKCRRTLIVSSFFCRYMAVRYPVLTIWNVVMAAVLTIMNT